MFRKLKNVMVELSTPKGSVFSGQARGVELRTTDGVIAINPQEESYLNLTQTTQITLRVGTEFLSFVLKNAAASLRDGRLTVLAEEVEQMPAAPLSAASRNGGPSP
jgi:F0F1-type ATP synthase epsilon subunit